jgi:Uma2 family endonuclease
MALHVAREPEIDFSTFPASDGKPMADTEVNLEQMIGLILEFRQAVEPHGHHVGGNLLVYYNPENGRDHCSPDVFVALDAGPALRESWKVWVEGKFPEVVFEVASISTQNTDIWEKVRLYEEQGAQEYYIYDPAGRLHPAYRGYVRQGKRFVQLPNPTGASIVSPLLGLELRVVQGWLRVINPATGEPYPSPREQQAQLLAAERRAWQEAQLRKEAEAHAARESQARAAAEALATEQTQARAAAEALATEQTQARAAAEALAAEQAQARAAAEAALQAALAELARLRLPPPE